MGDFVGAGNVGELGTENMGALTQRKYGKEITNGMLPIAKKIRRAVEYIIKGKNRPCMTITDISVLVVEKIGPSSWL
jgi:hypothetical protein